MLDILLAVTAASLLLLIFFTAFYYFGAQKKTARYVPELPVLKKRPPCLLCGSLLEKGMKMRSKEMQRKDDSLIYMYSCPFCEKGALKRSCPLCGKELVPDSYLVGRMFNKKNGKKHLRIAGCRECARKDL